jgi:hypothetical protein
LVPDLAANLNKPLSHEKRRHSMLLDAVTHTAAGFQASSSVPKLPPLTHAYQVG